MVGIKANFKADCYHILIKPSDYTNLQKLLKDKYIFVYSKELDKKFVTMGHSNYIDEVTIDVPVKPDSNTRYSYDEYKELLYDCIEVLPDDSDETRKQILADEYIKLCKQSKMTNLLSILIYHDTDWNLNNIKRYKNLAKI